MIESNTPYEIPIPCRDIDFKPGGSFAMSFTNNNLNSVTISLFDINGVILASPKMDDVYIFNSTVTQYVISSCLVGYKYIKENLSTYRPLRIDGFRMQSTIYENFEQSMQIHRKDINGIQVIEPYGLMDFRDIFQKQQFIDVKLGNWLMLTGDRYLTFSVAARSTINFLFSYSEPKNIFNDDTIDSRCSSGNAQR